MAVEIKIILAFLAFLLFRKAIGKARCRRLKRLRMLLMSRQCRFRSVLASLVHNSAAAKRAKRVMQRSVRHIFPYFMRVEKSGWTTKLLRNTIPA